jgi:hypothetical protein
MKADDFASLRRVPSVLRETALYYTKLSACKGCAHFGAMTGFCRCCHRRFRRRLRVVFLMMMGHRQLRQGALLPAAKRRYALRSTVSLYPVRGVRPENVFSHDT